MVTERTAALDIVSIVLSFLGVKPFASPQFLIPNGVGSDAACPQLWVTSVPFERSRRVQRTVAIQIHWKRRTMHRCEMVIKQYIVDGRGTGHGVNYQPWLQISRRGVPSNGNLVFRPLPVGRHGHFLSRNEWHMAMWLLWLGADDLREQFPLWPFAHPHPLHGRPELAQNRLPFSSGTLAIARRLGISHGYFCGTRIPYIGTTDLMLTTFRQGRCSAVAIALKPKDMLSRSVEMPQRVRERLALEMAYSAELSIPWTLLSDGEISRPLREGLELAVRAVGPQIEPKKQDEYGVALTELLEEGLSVEDAIGKAQRIFKVDRASAVAAFHHGIWHRTIPIDIREPIVMSEPAKLTDFAWAYQAAAKILGGNGE